MAGEGKKKAGPVPLRRLVNGKTQTRVFRGTKKSFKKKGGEGGECISKRAWGGGNGIGLFKHRKVRREKRKQPRESVKSKRPW